MDEFSTWHALSLVTLARPARPTVTGRGRKIVEPQARTRGMMPRCFAPIYVPITLPLAPLIARRRCFVSPL
jgi:hypothetical protein